MTVNIRLSTSQHRNRHLLPDQCGSFWWGTRFILILSVGLLSACASGYQMGRTELAQHREINDSDAHSVTRGQTIAAVVRKLGKPAKWGISDRGEHYAEWQRISIKTSTGMVGTGMGVNYVTTTNQLQGTKFGVYLDGSASNAASKVRETYEIKYRNADPPENSEIPSNPATLTPK